jgi:hypothetical protein
MQLLLRITHGIKHTHAHVAIAAKVLETIAAQLHRHERHMRVVHGLQLESAGGAVKVCISNQILDSVHHLLQQAPAKGDGASSSDSEFKPRGKTRPGTSPCSRIDASPIALIYCENVPLHQARLRWMSRAADQERGRYMQAGYDKVALKRLNSVPRI